MQGNEHFETSKVEEKNLHEAQHPGRHGRV